LLPIIWLPIDHLISSSLILAKILAIHGRPNPAPKNWLTNFGKAAYGHKPNRPCGSEIVRQIFGVPILAWLGRARSKQALNLFLLPAIFSDYQASRTSHGKKGLRKLKMLMC
jgi:hypothetical protein